MRAGQRHPLLLTARQLGGPVREALGQADAAEDVDGRLAPRQPGRDALDERRHHDVLLGGELGQQVVELEDEADACGCGTRPAAASSRVSDLSPSNLIAAGGRQIERAEDLQEAWTCRRRRRRPRTAMSPGASSRLTPSRTRSLAPPWSYAFTMSRTTMWAPTPRLRPVLGAAAGAPAATSLAAG
jgi:hypothetical protein